MNNIINTIDVFAVKLNTIKNKINNRELDALEIRRLKLIIELINSYNMNENELMNEFRGGDSENNSDDEHNPTDENYKLMLNKEYQKTKNVFENMGMKIERVFSYDIS